MRRSDDCITKQTLQWTPHGCRGRGRPRNTYLDKGSREINVDRRLQVELEEDGGGQNPKSAKSADI